MYKGNPIRQSADFSAKTAGQKELAWHIQSTGGSRILTKNTLTHKGYHLQLVDKQKTKEFFSIKLAWQEMLKTSLRWKEIALINNKKTCKYNNILGKGKYIVKVVDLLLINNKTSIKVMKQK